MDTSAETSDDTRTCGGDSTNLEDHDWPAIDLKVELNDETNTNMSIPSASEEQGENFYACIVCNLVFLAVPKVLEHIMKAHRGGILCLKCKYLMESNTQLKEHEKSCNNERPFFLEFIKCKICFGLCQQSETNDHGVCENCETLESKNGTNNPIASPDSLSPLQDSDQPNELQETDNTNNEYIDINTFLNFKQKDNDMNCTVDSNGSDCNAMNKANTKSLDNETVINEPNTVVISCDEPSSSLNHSSVNDQVSILCINKNCLCISFENANFEKPVSRVLCNMLHKLLSFVDGGFLNNIDNCIYCIGCKKDLLFFNYFKEHVIKYNNCKCFSCPLCGKTYIHSSLLDFVTHFDQHIDMTTKNNAVYCALCKVLFLNDFNLQKHYELYHHQQYVAQSNKLNTLSDAELQKIKAMKKLCTKQYLLDKFQIHCRLCKDDLPIGYYFDYHLVNCSKNEKYTCSFCYQHDNLTLNGLLLEMWLHCLVIETVNVSICDICQLNFPNTDNLLMHQANKHNNENTEGTCSQKNNKTTLQKQLSAQNIPAVLLNDALDSMEILKQRAQDITSQKNEMLSPELYNKDNTCLPLIKSFITELDAASETNVFNKSLSHSNNDNAELHCFVALKLDGNPCVSKSFKSKKASLNKPCNLIKSLEKFQFKKIGKDELKEVAIPPHVVSQIEYVLKYYKKQNKKLKNKKLKIFCVACKNDILFKEYICNHFISCFDINGGKCPLCCRESKDEQCNVLDHLMHVWNCHFVSKNQIKPKMCHKCDIMLSNSYNFVLHNAYKHSSKLVTKSSLRTEPFEFSMVKCEPCDDNDGNELGPQKMQRLG